ncbi:hypothetical protein ACQJBY_040732 [Aegilops geniculata]
MRESEAETRPPEAAGISPPFPPSSPDGIAGESHLAHPRSPGILAAVPLGGDGGSTRSDGTRRDQPHGAIVLGEGRCAQWQALFFDETDPGVWIDGRLRFTPHSRWLVLLDLENDILAGDYLPEGDMIEVIFRATAWIRTWSLLTPMDSREPLVTGCNQWEMVARAIFNRFGWRSHNKMEG